MKSSNFRWALFSITLLFIGIVATIVYVQDSTRMPFCDICSRQNPGEKLGFSSVSVTSPTNIQVNVVDTGSNSITLVYYVINDTRGDGYVNRTWSGPYVSAPSLAPGRALRVNLSLTGTLTGQSFQFQSQQTYTVELVTARNNPFTYTFTA